MSKQWKRCRLNIRIILTMPRTNYMYLWDLCWTSKLKNILTKISSNFMQNQMEKYWYANWYFYLDITKIDWLLFCAIVLKITSSNIYCSLDKARIVPTKRRDGKLHYHIISIQLIYKCYILHFHAIKICWVILRKFIEVRAFCLKLTTLFLKRLFDNL